MRIIGGSLAGHKFTPVLKDSTTRPTSERVKESLFNILMNRVNFTELSVLDLYAGSGNISFEFLSRGVEHCTAVENNQKAAKSIARAAEALGVSSRLHLYTLDVKTFLKMNELKYHIIFADPPYKDRNLSQLPDWIQSHNVLMNQGLLVIEHDRTNNFELHPLFQEHRKYGDTYLSFFKIQ